MILAAVSINAAFNTGIIDTAVNGAVNYAEAQRQEQVTFDELDSNLQDILNRINEYDVGGGSNPNVPDPTPIPDDEKQDGSWNGTKEVNSPKVAGTGLVPVYHNGTSWVDLTESSTEDEWSNWYDYENQKWANARTADGSMWVWIPRFEYQIQSGNKIDVRFIKTDVKAGTAGYTTDSTGIVKSSDDYIVHPAFMNDSTNSYKNGGWKSDISGFWIAKYPAGWQNGTNDVGTSLGSADMSSITYKTSGSSDTTYTGRITNNNTKMSYPVFKANTYAYNYITVGDAYTLSQDIKNAARYGLSNVDSHLEKNSEWGAIAYLAHSKYGVNGQDIIKANKTNKNNSLTGIHAVTSPETTINTSATQNITGVYDMSGCVWEYTPGFYSGSNPAYASGITIANSEYVTVYTSYERKSGDAIIETSGWNGDYAYFVIPSYPVFERGSSYNYSESDCGVFAFYYNSGGAGVEAGFRAVLIPN